MRGYDAPTRSQPVLMYIYADGEYVTVQVDPKTGERTRLAGGPARSSDDARDKAEEDVARILVEALTGKPVGRA